jgi:hypothetical protein
VDEETIEYLLEIGALEFDSVDESGENLYKFTKEAKDLVPEIYNEQMKDFNALVFSLWSKDLIDVCFDEAGEPLIGVNENSYDNNHYKKLSMEEFLALSEIREAWEEFEE